MKQWDHKINISLQVTTGHSALIIIAYRQTLDRASIQHDYVALFWVHIKDKWLKQLRSKVWLVSWPLITLILLRFLIDRRARTCVCVCRRSWIAETFFNCTLAVIRVIKGNGYHKLEKTRLLREAFLYPYCRKRSWNLVTSWTSVIQWRTARHRNNVIICWKWLLLLLLLLLFTAVECSLGGSSPDTSTDKTNKNKYT
jgi:hypothetical protein